MKVLVIDVGGSHIKMLATGQPERRQVELAGEGGAQHFAAARGQRRQDNAEDRIGHGRPSGGLPLVDEDWAVELRFQPIGLEGMDVRRGYGVLALVVRGQWSVAGGRWSVGDGQWTVAGGARGGAAG